MSDVQHVFRILERETVTLAPDPAGEVWYYDWAVKNPNAISQSMGGSFAACALLARELEKRKSGPVTNIVEYFGGLGGQAISFQAAFPGVWKHTICELGPAAAAHLTSLFPDAYVRQGSSYDEDAPLPDEESVVSMDFGDCTVRRLIEGEDQFDLLNRVVGRNPLGFLLTDVAGPRLQLQRKLYESILGVGTCASYRTYLAALAARICYLTGYYFVGGYDHWRSSVGVYVRDPGPSVDADALDADFSTWWPVPASPVGLEVFEL